MLHNQPPVHMQSGDGRKRKGGGGVVESGQAGCEGAFVCVHKSLVAERMPAAAAPTAREDLRRAYRIAPLLAVFT